MKKIAIALGFLLLFMIIASYVIGKAVLKVDEEVIYQVSTINALASGLYDGQESLTEIQNRVINRAIASADINNPSGRSFIIPEIKVGISLIKAMMDTFIHPTSIAAFSACSF